MKTPERWRPFLRCVLFANVFAERCHGVTSWQNTKRLNPPETSEFTFFNLVTLTFDLWPWPSKSSEILSRSMPPPNFAIGSLRQTVQPWERSQTDRHTHRRDWFYTLDRWRGREWAFALFRDFTNPLHLNFVIDALILNTSVRDTSGKIARHITIQSHWKVKSICHYSITFTQNLSYFFTVFVTDHTVGTSTAFHITLVLPFFMFSSS